MGALKRAVTRVGWRVAPAAMSTLVQQRAYRHEVRDPESSVQAFHREIDEVRGDARRIAELTDVLVERLAALEERATSGDEPSAS